MIYLKTVKLMFLIILSSSLCFAEMTPIADDVAPIDFSKMAYFDFKMYSQEEVIKNSKEYRWVQRINFGTKKLKKYIQKAYLVTDLGTYDLTLSKIDKIKDGLEEEGEPPTHIFHYIYKSDREIIYNKVVFLTFHKFEISDIRLFDSSNGNAKDATLEDFIGIEKTPNDIFAYMTKTKIEKESDGKFIARMFSTSNGKESELTPTRLGEGKCKKSSFDELSYYDCTKVQILAENKSVLFFDFGQRFMFKPLFTAIIKSKKHYFYSIGINPVIKDEKNIWKMSDVLQVWDDLRIF